MNISSTSNRLCQILILPGGRRLAYAEYGVPDGKPVFYFHGTPSSRLEPRVLGDELFAKAGLRLIAPDRPGMGCSDYLPGRGFSQWPEDVTALADALHFDRFAVFGISGGGGYVLACASKIPQRLTASVVASGAGRMDTPEALSGLGFPNNLVWKASHSMPWLVGPALKLLQAMSGKGLSNNREKALSSMLPADAEAFRVPGRIEAFIEMGRESMRPGTQGAAWDMYLYSHPWDFKLEGITFPVRLLHGEQDRSVPVAVARKIAAALPNCTASFYADQGHLSTPINYMDEILLELQK